MDDRLRVRGAERLGEVVRDPYGLVDFQPAPLIEDLPQRAAVDMVHRQEVQVAVLADVVDAHDVLVRDLAREHQLLLEAFEHARIRLVGTQGLQRDVEVQPLVVHAIDHAHRADAGEPDHAITAGDDGAGGEHPLPAERGFRGVRVGPGLRIGHGEPPCRRGSGEPRQAREVLAHRRDPDDERRVRGEGFEDFDVEPGEDLSGRLAVEIEKPVRRSPTMSGRHTSARICPTTTEGCAPSSVSAPASQTTIGFSVARARSSAPRLPGNPAIAPAGSAPPAWARCRICPSSPVEHHEAALGTCEFHGGREYLLEQAVEVRFRVEAPAALERLFPARARLFLLGGELLLAQVGELPEQAAETDPVAVAKGRVPGHAAGERRSVLAAEIVEVPVVAGEREPRVAAGQAVVFDVEVAVRAATDQVLTLGIE